MKSNIRWGILGCAGIAASRFIPGLKESTNGHLHSIASRGQAKLDEFTKAFAPDRAIRGYEELLADKEVDAVYIPLPNGFHKEWVLKCAAAGKHVLCEKPLGLNVQEVIEMQAACDKAGVKLMEAFAYRHSPLTLRVKSLVDDGTVGELRSIEAGFSFLLEDRSNVRFDKAIGGGATYDVGCYCLDLINYVAGREPRSLHAVGRFDGSTGIDVGSSAVIDFGHSLHGTSVCGFDAAFRSEYTIVGTKGVIRVPSSFNAKGKLEIHLSVDGKNQTIDLEVPDNYRLEIEQFGRCIEGRETPLVSRQSSVATATLIDQVLAAIETTPQA